MILEILWWTLQKCLCSVSVCLVLLDLEEDFAVVVRDLDIEVL
jgi:hypothetical protein